MSPATTMAFGGVAVVEAVLMVREDSEVLLEKTRDASNEAVVCEYNLHELTWCFKGQPCPTVSHEM